MRVLGSVVFGLICTAVAMFVTGFGALLVFSKADGPILPLLAVGATVLVGGLVGGYVAGMLDERDPMRSASVTALFPLGFGLLTGVESNLLLFAGATVAASMLGGGLIARRLSPVRQHLAHASASAAPLPSSAPVLAPAFATTLPNIVPSAPLPASAQFAASSAVSAAAPPMPVPAWAAPAAPAPAGASVVASTRFSALAPASPTTTTMLTVAKAVGLAAVVAGVIVGLGAVILDAAAPVRDVLSSGPRSERMLVLAWLTGATGAAGLAGGFVAGRRDAVQPMRSAALFALGAVWSGMAAGAVVASFRAELYLLGGLGALAAGAGGGLAVLQARRARRTNPLPSSP